MMKKTLGVLVGALLLATAASAANIPAYKNTPTLDGVISEGEYGADSVYVLDYDRVDEVGGLHTGEMTEDMKVVYHFAWDDDGIYIAATSTDSTPVAGTSFDVHGDAGGKAADGFQFAFFADDYGRWFTVGVQENGDVAARTHYTNASSPDCTGLIVGKGTFDNGTMTAEFYIPWDNVEFGLDGDSSSVYQHVFEEGTSLSMMFCYLDRDESGNTVARYKNLPADVWPGNHDNMDVYEDFIVLSGEMPAVAAPVETEAPETEAPVETEAPETEAPVETEAPETEAPVETEAPETEAPAETDAPETEAPVVAEPETVAPAETVVTPAETTKAPQTLDIVALMGGAAALSAVLAAKARKKRD